MATSAAGVQLFDVMIRVIEAAAKSGSLITARDAADLIQAELDDRLSDAERGELEALLQDPAARALRASGFRRARRCGKLLG
mgnify:CR=1 FL=1